MKDSAPVIQVTGRDIEPEMKSGGLQLCYVWGRKSIHKDELN